MSSPRTIIPASSQSHPAAGLLAAIDEAFSGKAWHGPTLRGSLRGVTFQEAAVRPAPGRHNIWEVAVHAAYWKYAVHRRLLGGKRGSFPEKGSNWFSRPLESSEAAWRRDLGLLDELHQALCDAARQVAPGGLDEKQVSLLRGIAFHDVYHAGQIQLLKRLGRAASR